MKASSRLLPLLAAAAVAAGCGGSDADTSSGPPPGDLTVVASTWNGWDPDYRSTPDTRTVPAREGGSTSYECLGDTIELSVVEVDDGSVTLTTSEELAPEGETGGSNLNDLTDRFEIEVDESVSFSTPTLDAGCSYTVELARA